jgi:uncharacterized membrane protein
MHTGAKPDWWLWPAAAGPILVALVLTLAGHQSMPMAAGSAPVTFADVRHIVDQRCHICHSARPKFPGFAEAPKGIMFDTPAQIRLHAPEIFAQAVQTHTMPLGNITEITDQERSQLGAWIAAGSRLN